MLPQARTTLTIILLLAVTGAIFELNQKTINEIGTALRASVSLSLLMTQDSFVKDLPALAALGRSKSELVKMFGTPRKEFEIEGDPQIFGIELTTFLKGDTELDFDSPCFEACLRGDRCIGVQIHRGSKSTILLSLPEQGFFSMLFRFGNPSL